MSFVHGDDDDSCSSSNDNVSYKSFSNEEYDDEDDDDDDAYNDDVTNINTDIEDDDDADIDIAEQNKPYRELVKNEVENQSNVSKSTDADDDNDNAAATTTTTDDNTNFRPINSKIINKESMNKSKSTTFVDALVEQPIIDCNLDRIKTRSCEANLQCKEHLKDISADDNAKKSVITNAVQIFDDYTLIDSEYTSNNSEYLQFNFSSRNILKRAVPGTWLYNKIITSTPILATKLLTMNMDVKSIEFAYMDPIKEIEINKQQPTLPI